MRETKFKHEGTSGSIGKAMTTGYPLSSIINNHDKIKFNAPKIVTEDPMPKKVRGRRMASIYTDSYSLYTFDVE